MSDQGTVVLPGSRLRLVEEHEGRVARLLLDHPPDNAFDVTLAMEFLTALEAVERWPRLSCLILEGSERDFSTGLSLSHRRMPYLDVLMTNHLASCRKLLALPALRIAVIRGRCFGAGLELALCCHELLCDATAKFAFPELSVAAFAPVGSLLLRDRIGQTRADDWILSGRTIAGDEALAAGLVTGYAAGWDGVDTLLERHLEQQVLTRPVSTLRTQARVLSYRAIDTLERFLPDTERQFREQVAGSKNHDEGIAAALRGRPARWPE